MMTTCTRKSNHHPTPTPTDMHAGRRAGGRVCGEIEFKELQILTPSFIAAITKQHNAFDK